MWAQADGPQVLERLRRDHRARREPAAGLAEAGPAQALLRRLGSLEAPGARPAGEVLGEGLPARDLGRCADEPVHVPGAPALRDQPASWPERRVEAGEEGVVIHDPVEDGVRE